MNRKSSFIGSLRDALRGICIFIAGEPHAKFHTLVAIAVCITGAIVGVSKTEWMLIAFAIALVMAAEAFNTAIEHMCNIIQPERDERIRTIKDIAAGAVLMCTIAAIVIGLSIFIPYLIQQ